MKRLALLACLACGFQEPAEDEKVDRLLLADRSEAVGDLVSFDPAGYLELKDRAAGRVRRLALEEIARLQFSKDDRVQMDLQADRVRLFFGGVLSGQVRAVEAGTVQVESPAGVFRLRRRDVRSLVFAGGGVMPDLRDAKRDVLIREVEKKEEGKAEPVKDSVADYGELKSLDAKRALFHVVVLPKEGEKGAAEGPGRDAEFPRASIRQVLFHQDEAPGDLPPGWFARVLFRNGDKLVGVLQGVGKDRIRIFSHLFGSAELEKRHVQSVTFVQHARMTVGNLLVCDQNGVREITRQNKEIWSYTQNAQHAWSARKLENGNVLIANTNFNQILEIKPTGKTGGEVAWKLDNCNFPYDAVRLENGNTLVAEYYASRVVEYDHKTPPNQVWQCAANYPMGVQRLADGNTLICSNRQVTVVNKEGQEKWRLNTGAAGVNPWRAQRLDNGNTVITDQQRNQVVEVDSESREVWRIKDLQRPVQAIRQDDGNVLILEQGQDRIIEVDPAHPKRYLVELKGLNYPQGMSTY